MELIKERDTSRQKSISSSISSNIRVYEKIIFRSQLEEFHKMEDFKNEIILTFKLRMEGEKDETEVKQVQRLLNRIFRVLGSSITRDEKKRKQFKGDRIDLSNFKLGSHFIPWENIRS